ncbi:helix-turn-helix transcriptional regulator [Aromatoleum bremense]|uniref:AlpA family phage regulatory protein n=1 Tax=Aromatoleum bremense TaxID=76115 RepID=A0ABX1P098_9RHOO|nr:AlpA family phage regulatory protein [Aromatoleum bremense]NMG17719.1 AlpA family phage regulatory protein [Aromatoleum bremense]
MAFDFAGDDVLLGIDEVCQKLSISRSTLDRLRQHTPPGTVTERIEQQEFSGLAPFPRPTIQLGRSPRWSAADLNKWIAACQKNM